MKQNLGTVLRTSARRRIEWLQKLPLLAAPALFFVNAATAEPSIQGPAADVALTAIAPEDVLSANPSTGDVAAPAADVIVRPWRIKGKPELKSNSVIIIDEADSSVLYSKRANVVVPVASITKLMTALVVLEGEQPLDELITITADDRDTEKNTTSRLTLGTELTRGDLLHLALMASENRAAHAIGRNYPGGLRTFVAAMNAKAKVLGMSTARFVDPTGLSSRNVSSAADLVKLVSAASRNPVIREFSTYTSYAVTVGRQLIEFRNTNALVAKPGWQIEVQKTGYTVDAGRCLVMKALIGDRSVLMVLLHSVGKQTRVADAGRIRKWMEAAAAPTQAVALNSRNL